VGCVSSCKSRTNSREAASIPAKRWPLFRFVQEAMANVHRHSGSKTVAVEIQIQMAGFGPRLQIRVTGFQRRFLEDSQASDGHLGGVGIPE